MRDESGMEQGVMWTGSDGLERAGGVASASREVGSITGCQAVCSGMQYEGARGNRASVLCALQNSAEFCRMIGRGVGAGDDGGGCAPRSPLEGSWT
jgi:hypothetical protein